MTKHLYANPHNLRPHFAKFFEDQGYTHFLPLNSERPLTVPRIKNIFGAFCKEVDRKMLNVARVEKRPSCERLRAVAVPEHLESNAHLHCLIDLKPLLSRFSDSGECEAFLQSLWKGVSRTGGSIDLQLRTGVGAAAYALKVADRRDPTYFLSSDFHPH
jgi:hypothetical protein